MTRRTIAIVDYGAGNIKSVYNALSCFDVKIIIAEDQNDLLTASSIILPGVGSFDRGIQELASRGHLDVLNKLVFEKGIPFLGICLGMQLLFESSEEGSEAGLGWIKGRVTKFPQSKALKIPHIGWNEVDLITTTACNIGLEEKTDFYFVHSYYIPLEPVHKITSGVCNYGIRFCAALEIDNIHAVQFHPEKSQLSGMKFLENFIKIP